MNSFLSNPAEFKRQYILKIRDTPSRPSAVVGGACHKALEAYYTGASIDKAIEIGLEQINQTADFSIEYGKTGTRQGMVNSYGQGIRNYFEELPVYHEILDVEADAIVETTNILIGGKLALPVKAKIDLVTRNQLGELEIVDHKFVKSYSDDSSDTVQFKKFLQGMFYFHMVKEKYGEEPKRIIYAECKIPKNKDNSEQLQPYTFEFDDANRNVYFGAFYKLFDACNRNLMLPGLSFLPNPNDIYDGEYSFKLFVESVDSIDTPMAVPHKKEAVKFVDKHHIPSAFDRVENQDFTPEERIRQKLMEFNISVSIQQTHIGPSVTQYTFKPPQGIAMSKFSKMSSDLALALEAKSVRIEAPIRGTSVVGVEVPSKERRRIDLADSHLRLGTMDIPIGVDVYGNLLHKNLADMPHLLIAGATGTGKSVMLNVLIKALTKQLGPDKLQLVLIDPKRVELSLYDDLPHLLLPIVYEDQEIADTLSLLTEEMDDRYKLLQKSKTRSIDDYPGDMPRIVVIVDEFADMMMTASDNSSERHIIRIAQKARAVGIHLVLATQRPSADVVTGLIKANVPTKIALATTTGTNSRIILDELGAEELTGKGDMLYSDPVTGIIRLQGLYA